jgi:hypothetical protein
MFIMANFGSIGDLITQMQATVDQVEARMFDFAGASSAAEADWLDRAGAEYAEVRMLWQRVSDDGQAMLAALKQTTGMALDGYIQTVQAGEAAVAV